LSPRCRAKPNLRVERAVLAFVLYEHPSAVKLGSLEREVGKGTAQAVADLAAVGLLSRDGGTVRPTPAAVRFEALEAS
jgi:hypothetical protein